MSSINTLKSTPSPSTKSDYSALKLSNGSGQSSSTAELARVEEDLAKALDKLAPLSTSTTNLRHIWFEKQQFFQSEHKLTEADGSWLLSDPVFGNDPQIRKDFTDRLQRGNVREFFINPELTGNGQYLASLVIDSDGKTLAIINRERQSDGSWGPPQSSFQYFPGGTFAGLQEVDKPVRMIATQVRSELITRYLQNGGSTPPVFDWSLFF
jgi:hypothetical protein